MFRVFLVTLLAQVGCAGPPVYHHLDSHPEFLPIVPVDQKQEIQLTSYRSWHPMIYLRASFRGGKFEEGDSASISYSISEHQVTPLQSVSISVEQWKDIVQILEESGFWNDGWTCYERAYRESTLYASGSEPCSEILLSDGATLSVAASVGSRSKGVRVICPLNDDSFQNCGPLGELGKVILRSIGRTSLP